MFRKKRMIFIMMLFILLFVTSCANTGDSVYVEQTETSESANTIEQPVLTLENLEKGVLVTWNEIPDAEGYYVYSKIEGDKFKKIATISDPTVVEYIDLEAPSGTRYCYTVRAFIGDQKSDYDTFKITTGIWEPEIKVSYSEPEMKISWKKILGCEGYIVYRKEEGGKYSVVSTINDSETTSYIDAETTPGKIYTYAVRAYIGEEKSSYTGVAKATIGQPIVEVNNLNEGVEISWNEIETAEGYYVYRKEEGGKYEIIHQIEDAKTTTYLDTNYSVGIKYLYTVRAYLGEQKSDYSGVDITADLGRVTVSLSTVGYGVQVSWNEIAAAEGYNVYRKAEGEEEYTLVDTIDDTSIISYVDQQLESGKTYYYNVRAFLGDAQSSYSGGVITIE